jgi:hypothetical protein
MPTVAHASSKEENGGHQADLRLEEGAGKYAEHIQPTQSVAPHEFGQTNLFECRMPG